MLLILLVLVLLFGWGGYIYGPRLGYAGNPYYGGGIGAGTIIVIIVILLLLRII
jgi:hypothetical protein